MLKENCRVVENKKIAPGHWVMTLHSAAIAKAARPGQFAQLLCADDSFDPLLPRPFSFLDASVADFSILYHVVGKGTELLSKTAKGESLRVLGPLGNGFSLKPGPKENLILVGGGVGIPPLFHLARTLIKNKTADKKKIEVILGARNKSLLLCAGDFKKLGVKLTPATNDGSKGVKGLVTEPLRQSLQPISGPRLSGTTPYRIYTCGPTPMLKAVSEISVKCKVPCEVSVEVPMACGFGACLGCAIAVKDEAGNQRFAIACTEGPVFESSRILW